MAQLSERDRGLIQNKIDELKKNNTQLQESITEGLREVNNLTLFDISSKKFVDEKHAHVYSLEEERRLLTGKTIIAPVQENAFQVTTTEPSTTISINDGRFLAKKNNIPFVDVPIISSRAFIVSKSVGPDFEIWTRDRYGSSTSEKNVPQTYRIHSGNNKLKVKIDNVEKEIIIIDEDILTSQTDGTLIVDPLILSAQVKSALNDAGFTDAECFYNQSILTFTITSGTVGPSSTVEVISANTTDDLSVLMKFTSSQVKVPGKYANNKLKVKIDNVEQQIEMVFDTRIPVFSSLGYALDDYSQDWRQNFNDGPMFPAASNNGAIIASMIQSKLREVASGGYTSAECTYYLDSQKFIVYSGSFGATSSIEFLPASDTNRDLLSFIGMNEPTDRKANETSYETLLSLYDYLNQKTVISCSNLNNPSYKCYSIISLNNVPISSVSVYLQTTSDYDNASLSRPRLYGNKLRVDTTNNHIDIIDTTTVVKTIPSGLYVEAELAELLQDTLNNGSTNKFTVQYKSKTATFIIAAQTTVTLLFGTGTNKNTSIATCIGFANFVDINGTSFTSNAVTFSGADFYSMTLIPQFVSFTYLNNEPPYYIDVNVSFESSLLNSELTFLQFENSFLSEYLSSIYNEAHLNKLESIVKYELSVCTDVARINSKQLTTHAMSSMTDTEYYNLLNEYNSVMSNINSIHSLSIRSETTVIPTSSFSEGGNEVLAFSFVNPPEKLYDTQTIECRYSDNKYLPMHNMSPLFSNSINFKSHFGTAFLITTNMTNYVDQFSISHAVTDVIINITNSYISTIVYWSSGSEEDLHYDYSSYNNVVDILNDIILNYTSYQVSLKAELWSRFKEKFILFSGDNFSIKIGNQPTQTITISATMGSSISDLDPAVIVGIADTLILSINSESSRTITFTTATSNGYETANAIEQLIRSITADNIDNQPAYTNFTCRYNGSLFYLYSGTSGTLSSVNVSDGTAKVALKLGLNELTGTGLFTNNYSVSTNEVISNLSGLVGVIVSNDNSYIKFSANDKIEIISSDAASRLGFYLDNLLCNPTINVQNIPSSSLIRVNESILSVIKSIDKGYENKSIVLTYSIINNAKMSLRQAEVLSRINDILARLTQIINRILEINSQLTPTLYNDRWNEVVKRLNKKTGSYFKVGEKQIEIINTQQSIIENNNKIAELQAMLG
jgi:hypothetical protein